MIAKLKMYNKKSPIYINGAWLSFRVAEINIFSLAKELCGILLIHS